MKRKFKIGDRVWWIVLIEKGGRGEIVSQGPDYVTSVGKYQRCQKYKIKLDVPYHGQYCWEALDHELKLIEHQTVFEFMEEGDERIQNSQDR